MTIQEWLSGVKYTKNPNGAIFNSQDVCVLDITGFGVFSRILPSTEKSLEFVDSVGQFVVEAINEKLENDKGIESAWKKIKEFLGDTDFIEKSVNYNTKLGEVVVKFYKYCKKNNTKESEKFQIDNLDWCKLILNEDKTVDVENEHNSRYSIIDLDVEELDIILQLL